MKITNIVELPEIDESINKIPNNTNADQYKHIMTMIVGQKIKLE